MFASCTLCCAAAGFDSSSPCTGVKAKLVANPEVPEVFSPDVWVPGFAFGIFP